MSPPQAIREPPPETDVVPTLADIYSDFDKLRQKARIGKFKAKFVKRKYAFGEKDVPREERQWMKVVYPFSGMYLRLDCIRRRMPDSA